MKPRLLRTCTSIAHTTKLNATHTYQASRRSIPLLLCVAQVIATTDDIETETTSHGLPTYKQSATKDGERWLITCIKCLLPVPQRIRARSDIHYRQTISYFAGLETLWRLLDRIWLARSLRNSDNKMHDIMRAWHAVGDLVGRYQLLQYVRHKLINCKRNNSGMPMKASL